MKSIFSKDGRMRRSMNSFADIIVRIISSKYFYYATIIFFVLEAAWIAFSFNFPMVLDERFHFGVISIFTNHVSPIVLNQPETYDVHGSFLYGSVSIYHYMLSMPLRLVQLYTSSEFTQVVFLRLLNIAFAATGIVLYSKLFDMLKVKRKFTNLAILVFILLPLTSLIAATINYDNLMFMITPLFLIFAVRVLRARTAKATASLLFISVLIGLLGSLVKFSFLPLFMGVALYLIYVLILRHRKKTFAYIWSGIRSQSKISIILLMTGLIAMVGLFSMRYLTSVYRYGTPIPSCTVALSLERCSANPVVNMEVEALRTKSQRNVVSVDTYVVDWLQSMAGGYSSTATNTVNGVIESEQSPALYLTLRVAALYLTVIILVYNFKSIKKFHSREWKAVIVAMATLVIVTMVFNMTTYYQVNLDMNVQPRYILPIMLPGIVLGMIAVNKSLGHRRVIKMLLLMIFIVFSTQGAGVMLHINKSNESWYWQKPKILKTNRLIRSVADPLYLDN